MTREAEDWRTDINEGLLDRTIRIAAGLATLSLVFVGPQSIFGAIGLLPLVTGVSGYCPLYASLGISTVGTPHRVTHA